MTRLLKILFRITVLLPAIAVLIFFFLFATLKTSWGQNLIETVVNDALHNQEIPIRLVGIEGKTPLLWNIRQVQYDPITLHNISIRFSPLALLHGRLRIEEVFLQAEQSSLSGRLDIELRSGLVRGALYGNIHQISSLFPSIEGQLGFECLFSHANKVQEFDFHALVKHLRYRTLLINALSLSAHLIGGQGSIDCRLEKVYTPQAYFTTVAFNAHSQLNDWQFTLESESLWAEGTFAHNEILFKDIHGQFAMQPLQLTKPCSLQWNTDRIELSESSWSVGNGSLVFGGFLDKQSSDVHLTASHVPIGLFPHFNATGTITAQAQLHSRDHELQGAINIALEEAALQKSPTHALSTKGSVQIHIDSNRLQMHTYLSAEGEQFFDAAASLPIRYTHTPFSFSIDPSHPSSGEITMEGKVEDLFDFINIGTHHVSGFVSTHLFFFGNWNALSSQGTIDLHNASYENYYTGTSLQHIDAHLTAQDRTLRLVHLCGSDGKEGSLTATGTLHLSVSEGHPYTIETDLTHVHLLRFNTIDATLTGPMQIQGNAKSALVSGTLTIPHAEITIPDHLPLTIPQIPVTFIHRPSNCITTSSNVFTPFPLHIDLHLSTPEHIFVNGKGLSSEWQGDVHLTGINSDVAAVGTLTLMHGEYQFAGNRFQLTEGTILFKNHPTPSATIAITGNLSLSDLEVYAHLRGPLTSPQLTFQSNPHLATSAILAKVLFNKNLSDISQPEALQLANTLVSLSGSAAPDVLETIRKSIGVDRLTVVSDPGSDQIALQIGKYLTKGVLVTLSQSTTSSQIIVEVELNKNFIFRAETQEEEEGKFSLKWRKSW